MTIPVVDANAATFPQDLRGAFRDTGFAAVVGHGIEPAQFDQVRSIVRTVFELPDTVKSRLRITRTNYRGFIPLGFFTPNRIDATGADADEYEGYKLHWECPDEHPVRAECGLYGPNRWPDEVPELRTIVSAYWQACDHASRIMLDAVAASLGVTASDLRCAPHHAPLTNMTLLHYPARAGRPGSAGIHPHKDTNVITLLPPDPVGGLELRTIDGEWSIVDAPPDALVVNVGEMLELWSGGDYRATPHRVVNRTGAARYSFPFFVVPNHAVTVKPLIPRRMGYDNDVMAVGHLSAEVWRTNWPDQTPSDDVHDLGTLDR